MDIVQTLTVLGQGVLLIIGGATIIFRIVHPLTETKWDDKVYKFLSKTSKVLEKLSLNKETTTKVNVRTSK
jgi:hypothetical protein